MNFLAKLLVLGSMLALSDDLKSPDVLVMHARILSLNGEILQSDVARKLALADQIPVAFGGTIRNQFVTYLVGNTHQLTLYSSATLRLGGWVVTGIHFTPTRNGNLGRRR